MAFEEPVMTHSEPRDPGRPGRPVRLHGLFALMLAASVAIGAIAAAVAILDHAVRPAGGTSASQAADSGFTMASASSATSLR
jgi:hypothetical protein